MPALWKSKNSTRKSSFVIFYHCDETIFVGANLSYEKARNSSGNNFTESSRDLTSFQVKNFNDSCFSESPFDECECSLADPLARFDPVCINGLSYFSPCYAGCNSMNHSAITECSCISNQPLQGTVFFSLFNTFII